MCRGPAQEVVVPTGGTSALQTRSGGHQPRLALDRSCFLHAFLCVDTCGGSKSSLEVRKLRPILSVPIFAALVYNQRLKLPFSCGCTIRQTCKCLPAMVRQPDSKQYLLRWCRQLQAVYGPAECSKVFNTGWGNKNFLSSQSLFDTEQGFMQGQEMIVGVHISAIEPAIKRQKRMQDTAPQFGPFFDDPSTSDIVVMAGEAKIHAHKIILSAQSTFFKGMFQTGTKESTAQEVEMGEIEGPTLTALISFMYGRLGAIPTDILIPLFTAADAHQVDKLGWLCMQQMIAAMSKKTVLEVIKVADAVTDTELMDICMKFLLESENSYEIAEQPAMQELMLNNPSLAQKLLVGIMKHAAPKKASLETA
ncbi:TPA: Galactose oxidase, central domain [Trebouxia sp. C0005]